MKILTPIILVLIMTAACKPASRQSPPSPISSQASSTPITGAFGYKLGEKLDAAISSETDEEGASLATTIETTNFPPFDTVGICALMDRRIYCVIAFYHGDNWHDDKSAVEAALEAKYGPARLEKRSTLRVLCWGNDHRSISLGEKSLVYGDYDLQREHDQDVAAAKAKKIKQIIPNL